MKVCSFSRFVPVVIVLLLGISTFLGTALADVHVSGYTKKDGTYVAPYTRSDPNGEKNDNFSTKGNVNPYTGKAGTKKGDATSGVSGDAVVATDGAASNPHQGASAADRSALWGRVKPRMSKDDVTKVLGRPNAATSSKWIYTDGGKITFDDSGLVTAVAPAN